MTVGPQPTSETLLVPGTNLDGVLGSQGVSSVIAGTVKPGLTGYLAVFNGATEETVGSRVAVTGAFTAQLAAQGSGSGYRVALMRSASSPTIVHQTPAHRVLPQPKVTQGGGIYCHSINNGVVTTGAPLSVGGMLGSTTAYLVLYNYTSTAEDGARSAAQTGTFVSIGNAVALTPTGTGEYAIRAMSAASGGTMLFETPHFIVAAAPTVTFATPAANQQAGTAQFVLGTISNSTDIWVCCYNQTTSTEEPRVAIAGRSWYLGLAPLAGGTYVYRAYAVSSGGSPIATSATFVVAAAATGTVNAVGGTPQQGVPVTVTGTYSNAISSTPCVQLFVGGNGDTGSNAVPVTLTPVSGNDYTWTASITPRQNAVYTAHLSAYVGGPTIATSASFTATANASPWADIQYKSPYPALSGQTTYYTYASGNLSGSFWIGLTPGGGTEETRAGPFTFGLNSAYAAPQTVNTSYVARLYTVATGGTALAVSASFPTQAQVAPGSAAGLLSVVDYLSWGGIQCPVMRMTPPAGGVPTSYTGAMRLTGAGSFTNNALLNMSNTNPQALGGVNTGSLYYGGTPMTLVVPPWLLTVGSPIDVRITPSNAAGAATAAVVTGIPIVASGAPYVGVCTQGSPATFNFCLGNYAVAYAELVDAGGTAHGSRVKVDISTGSVQLTPTFNGMATARLWTALTGGIYLAESAVFAITQASPNVSLSTTPTAQGVSFSAGYTPSGTTSFWLGLYGPYGDEVRTAVTGATSGTPGSITVPGPAYTGGYAVHAYDTATPGTGHLLGSTATVLI